MKIVIKDFKDKQVFFESEYGIGIAKWSGETPAISQELHVELGVNANLVFGVDVTLIKDSSSKISNSEGICIILGKIESVDEDDYVTVRIGKNMLCCVIEGLKEFVGRFVEIRTVFLELSNMNY